MKKNQDKIELLKSQVDSVPTKPGCYLWKDADNKIIYVGKAKNLRSRMRQYLNFSDEREKIPLLVDEIDSFDYIVVKNENESLILEKNLIQQFKPYYNADFKDDKSYPFIAITKGDIFPAIKYTREKHNSSTVYFGPYTDGRAARRTVDIVRRVVPICSFACAEWRKLNRSLGTGLKLKNFNLSPVPKVPPCFDCTVGLGPGACCGKISPEEYAENVKKVERFLNGNQSEFIVSLEEQMKQAADELDFEKAARFQKRIETVKLLSEKQHIVSKQNLNADVIGFYREETIAGVHVLVVREGRIINSNEFVLNRGLDIENTELVHMFLLRYYDSITNIPRYIIVREIPDDADQTEDWLTKKMDNIHGAKVKFEIPKIGEKMDMLKMAELNAKHSLMRYKVRNNYDDKRINKALMQLESAIAMENSPMRIECFDISTIHGAFTVASMVVFVGGKPDKNSYRRFKIKTPLNEANDFLSMQEVLKRRYSADKMKDKDFAQKPDLILLDGGKPQLSAAMKIFKEIGFDWKAQGTSLAGLAKADEELIVSYDDKNFDNIILPDGSESLYLVKQVRDEAHRFAITFHRQLRDKAMTSSILDEVPGLGPVRKKTLLKKFGSFKKLKAASLEQIKDAKIIPVDIADELYFLLHNFENKS